MTSFDPDYAVEMKLSMYARGEDGDQRNLVSFGDALAYLTSENGYRLTLSDEFGNEIIIRCLGDFKQARPAGKVCTVVTIAVLVPKDEKGEQDAPTD